MIYRLFQECDGVVHATNSLYEGPTLEKWQEWFGRRPSLAVGPIYTDPQVTKQSGQQALTPEGLNLMKFLDDALEQYGEKSVIYVNRNKPGFAKILIPPR
jgi:hypothetical protein